MNQYNFCSGFNFFNWTSKEDPDINSALKWLINHQENTGLHKLSYSGIHKSKDNKKAFKTDYRSH